MTSRLIGRDRWLTDSEVTSEALARVEVVQGLAGRARMLWELATGQAVDQSEPCSLRNPQGLVGVDCSGPPWGSAHRYPIATLGGRTPDSAAISTRAPTLLDDKWHTIHWKIWHRPYEPSPDFDAPLSRGYLCLGLDAVAGTPTVYLEAWSNGQSYDDASTYSTATTTTDTDYDTGVYVPLLPGANTLHLRLSASANVYLTRVALWQKAKRAH